MGAFTMPAPVAAFRAMRRSPPRRSAPVARWPRLKALEWAGVLTWQNRITRILVREPRAGVHGARLVSFPGVQGVRRNLFSPRGIVSRFGSRDVFAGQRDKPCG